MKIQIKEILKVNHFCDFQLEQILFEFEKIERSRINLDLGKVKKAMNLMKLEQGTKTKLRFVYLKQFLQLFHS